MKRVVNCSFCNHKQKTRSKLDRITCSNCGRKFYEDNRELKEEEPKPKPKPLYNIGDNNFSIDNNKEDNKPKASGFVLD